MAWLGTGVTALDPDAEPLLRLAYSHLRRLERAAVRAYVEEKVEERQPGLASAARPGQGA